MVALAILSPVFFPVRTTHRRQDRRRYAKDTVDSTFVSCTLVDSRKCLQPVLAADHPRAAAEDLPIPGNSAPLRRCQHPPIDLVGFRVGLGAVFQVEDHPAAGAGGVADAGE